MTVFFLDEFNGSGPLDGHVPDINLASGAAWVTGSGNSGTAWDGDSNAVLSGGSLVAIGTGYIAPLILNPGQMQVAPFDSYPLPPEVFTGSPYKFSWSWTPSQDSTAPLVAYGLLLRVGTASFLLNNTPGATKDLLFGDHSVPVGYAAGVVYTGSLEVRANEQILSFLGQTLVFPDTGELVSDLRFGDIYLNLDGGHSLGFLKVESLAPSSFWVSKVGCTESQT